MVVHDDLFKKDLSKMSDEELKNFRREQVSHLFDGYKESLDNVERECLIREIDIEREMRFKKQAERRSNVALIVSICAIFISFISLILKYLVR